MFAVIVTERGGGTERHAFNQNEVTIGRVQGNDIILAKGNVSKRHTRIVLKDGRFIVVDLKSTNGTYVNGRKVTSPLVVKPGDKIYIGDFTVSIEGNVGTQSNVPARPGSDPSPAAHDAPPPLPAMSPTSNAVPPIPRGGSEPAATPAPPTGEAPRPSPKTWEPPRRAELAPSESTSARPQSAAATPPRPPLAEVGSRGASTKHTSAFEAMANVVGDRNLAAVMTRLEVEYDVQDTTLEGQRDDQRWTDAERLAERAVQKLLADGQLEEADASGLAAAAVREAVGLGALEALLTDERVREILVSGPARVEVDFGEGLETSLQSFSSGRVVMTVVKRLAAQAGVFVDNRATSLDFLLPTGAHVTVLLPPIVTGSPVIEIRRVHRGPTLDELHASHAISGEQRAAVLRAVAARRSIAVVGTSGSGVTTVLSAIASVYSPEERVVVASAEPGLRLERDHVVHLSCGTGPNKLRFREVVEHAARLRSARLVLDGVTSDDARLAFARLGGRATGDLVGLRMRPTDAPLAALLRVLDLGGASADEARVLLEHAVQVVVELDAEHGVRRVKRVLELRKGSAGLELVEAGG